MPDHRRTVCRESKGGCGKSSDEVGSISWDGLCATCGRARMEENVDQMEARHGPNWTKWRRGMVACVHPELLELIDAGP